MSRQSAKDKAAGRIAEFILNMQVRAARFLNKRAEQASGRQKKLVLLFLILTMGGYSLYLLLAALTS